MRQAMTIIQNDQAESPIEVLFVLMSTVITMALLILVFGPFVDSFIFTVSKIDIELSPWGQTMMDLLPNRFAHWIYLVPMFFIILIMVWGLKTVIKRHQYTKEEDYQSYEFD
jgi:hypothetical protein